MNTAIRKPLTPLMARAMRKAIEAAREARLSGRMPKKLCYWSDDSKWVVRSRVPSLGQPLALGWLRTTPNPVRDSAPLGGADFALRRNTACSRTDTCS